MITTQNHWDDRKVVLVDQAAFDRQVAVYEELVKKLAQHGLIWQGAGGILIIAHPRTQVQEGIYHECQVMARNTGHLAVVDKEG